MNHYHLACAAGLWLLSHTALAQEPITVAWRIKPPHQYLDNGVEKGILLERAKQIFNAAQIPSRFVEEPAKRIWSNFSGGTKNYCSFGWYRVAEREALVQFSEPFHTDPPHTLLVSPAATKLVAAHRTLKSLMSDTSLTLGIVDAVSYGPELDAMFVTTRNKIERSTTLPMIMARMVAANRASYMLIDREDWEYLKDKEESLNQTTQMDLQGMPAGLNRYIVCSKDVSVDQMRKINTALLKIYPTKK
ncbi:transporter substrate-binding domain-containing protein [Undibacterium pigrum]|uniref:Uncharacterized protein (TIGR02285 family) n=1 Tax=Undibacterium pigrum TaxID=401470 RepID=A0A318IUW1_9BURK|nr:transporter substrate-binding domain-containing protein [Undibacterium pigrum]PXX39956.1 uncharacterized protein (TIGR02285 family) [Undibacterium pigrum]